MEGANNLSVDEKVRRAVFVFFFFFFFFFFSFFLS
jgi:hypothetical protein